MQRFYKGVQTEQAPGGFTILLDGRPVLTPGPPRHRLIAATQALADAIAQEWSMQGAQIEPGKMPLTQILYTRLDRVGKERAAMQSRVLTYLNSDLLCYRAETPHALAQAQAAAWDPWLAWFTGRFDVALQTTTSLRVLTQPEAAHKAAGGYVCMLDDDRFTALQLIVSVTGSLVMGLAALEGAAQAEDLFKVARVEELYKAHIYNEDLHGPDPLQGRKDAAAQADLQAACRYLSLLSRKP